MITNNLLEINLELRNHIPELKTKYIKFTISDVLRDKIKKAEFYM